MSTIKEIFLALAAVLLIAGAVGYNWVISEENRDKELTSRQQEQVYARFAEAHKVLKNEINIQSFSVDVPQGNPLEELDEHLEREEARTEAWTISVICLAAGSAIFAGWVLLTVVWCIRTGSRHLMKLSRSIANHLNRGWDKICSKKDRKMLQKLSHNEFYRPRRNRLAIIKHVKDSALNVFGRMGQVWRNLLVKDRLAAAGKKLKKQSLTESGKSKENPATTCDGGSDYLEKEHNKIDALYCDEKWSDSKERADSDAVVEDLNAQLFGQLEQNLRQTILSGYLENVQSVKNSLKTHSETLEKQVSEVRQMAETIQKASAKDSEPVKDTLDELTRQVSAIREYTTFQHEKIEKLQEGYDWNIIRTFCLRIIRCIDNLENRITRLSEEGADTTDLEEIMDELVFALESSGVEQFRPEVNSDYNGKEKLAEVIKDKLCPNDPNMSGKIAEVIKPGYQYVIDDANVRVVRAAQVRLFG